MDAFSRDVLHIYRVIVAFSIKAWHLADGALCIEFKEIVMYRRSIYKVNRCMSARLTLVNP